MGYVNIPTPPVDTTYLMKTNDENELTQDFSKVAGARTATRENIWNRKFNIDPVGIYYRTSHGIKIVVPLQNDRDMIKYKFEYSDQWGNYVASGEIWCLYSTNYYYSKVGGYVTGDFPFGEILIGTGSSGEWIVYISSRETRNAQFRITEATGFNHKHVDNDYSYLVDVPTVTATTSSGITSSSNYPGSIAPIAKAANSFGTSAAYGGNSMLVNKGTTYPSGTVAIRKYEIKLPELIDASTTSTWGVQLEIETYDAIVGNGKATISFRYSAHYNAFYDYSYVWEGKSYPVMNDLLLGESGNRVILQFGDGVNTVANSRLVVTKAMIIGTSADSMVPEDFSVHQYTSTQWSTLNDTQVVPIWQENNALNHTDVNGDLLVERNVLVEGGEIKTNTTAAQDLSLTCGTNKTLELQDIVWTDMAIAVSTVRMSASKAPTWASYKGGKVLSFSASADNKIYFTAQLPHGYATGQDIEFHLHVAYTDANSGNSKWNMTHSWANIGDVFPTETAVTATKASAEETDNHQLLEIAGTISGTGKGISSVLNCSLEREGTHADDTYGSEIYLISADFHYPVDTIGSRFEKAK